MKTDTIYLKVDARVGSALEQAIRQFISCRNKDRSLIQNGYDKKVKKQIKKIERSGL